MGEEKGKELNWNLCVCVSQLVLRRVVAWIGRVACKGYLGLHPTITASAIVWMMRLLVAEVIKMVWPQILVT